MSVERHHRGHDADRDPHQRDLPGPITEEEEAEEESDREKAGVLSDMLVQRYLQSRAGGEVPRDAAAGPEQDSAEIQRHAAAGVAGSGGALPHRDRIQASFGRHDVSGVQAHVGGDAATAADAIGAEAYATGDQVAFRTAPDLHTAAHEAAHVVQQRAGVQLKGGVGEVGDVYERQADEVADKVVRGESAETLLDSSKEVSVDGAVQRNEAARPRANRQAIIANTILDKWQLSVENARLLFATRVKSKGPPPGKALVSAILSIGINVTAARIFGELISDAATHRMKAVYRIGEGVFKKGTEGLVKELQIAGGSGDLRIPPADFSNMWTFEQNEAINEERTKLLGLLRDEDMSEEEMDEMQQQIGGSALSTETAVQILLQQYSRALYDHSGGEGDGQGLVSISMSMGTSYGGGDLDRAGVPVRAALSIQGVDTRQLGHMRRAFPGGIDPVALGMPCKIHLQRIEERGIAGPGRLGDSYDIQNHELYFDSNGALQRATGDAVRLMTRWGGAIPVVENFGPRMPVVGWSRKVL
jgi:hypothetical protein